MFQLKAMAIQDPFVQNHNIAQNVNIAARDLIITEISLAATTVSN